MHNITTTMKAMALLALALALGACSQSTTPPTTPTPPDPLQSFKDQNLSWTECDPTLVPFPAEVNKVLEGRVQCADIKAPLDWNSPARGTISIGLLRVTASDKAKRQGSLFFNPGGPGGDGLLAGAIFAFLSSRADTTTPAGVALKSLSDQYDLIGFSPRGTGQSSRLTCGSNEQSSAVQYPSEDRSPENIAALLRNARLLAQACLKNPITPYINTDQTARDLNLSRQLLGDAKLNYVGYSYGTWLGAWYAKLFPQSTGRMLLDGNTAFAGNFEDSFNQQPLGYERAFRDSALAYAARHNDRFGLGTTKNDVYAVYNSYPSAVKFALQAYSNPIIRAMNTTDGITGVATSLLGARGLSAVVKASPELSTFSDLASRLDLYTYSSDTKTNAAARNEALELLGSYLDIVNKVTEPIDLAAGSAVFIAVVNNDSPATQNEQFWTDFGNKAAVEYPLVGGGFTSNKAIYWSKPTTSKPATPANLPPILMLQNELDPATPREGALKALASLPSAKMIFVDDEASHTAFPYGDQCVDGQVANYFLSGALPDKKFNVCAALPLPGEDQVYPLGESYAAGDLIPAQALQKAALGGTPETAEALKLLKDILSRNALAPRR